MLLSNCAGFRPRGAIAAVRPLPCEILWINTKVTDNELITVQLSVVSPPRRSEMRSVPVARRVVARFQFERGRVSTIRNFVSYLFCKP